MVIAPNDTGMLPNRQCKNSGFVWSNGVTTSTLRQWTGSDRSVLERMVAYGAWVGAAWAVLAFPKVRPASVIMVVAFWAT